MTNQEIIKTEISLHKDSDKLYQHFAQRQLLTFMEWKKRGYSVKKGEKASLQPTIWKRVKNKKKKESNEKEYIFIRKKASLFTLEQVTKN